MDGGCIVKKKNGFNFLKIDVVRLARFVWSKDIFFFNVLPSSDTRRLETFWHTLS